MIDETATVVVSSTTKTITGTATQIFDNSTAPLTIGAPTIREVDFVNCDTSGSVTMYLGYTPSVGPGNFWRQLAPGQGLEDSDRKMGRGVALSLYAKAVGGGASAAAMVAVLA